MGHVTKNQAQPLVNNLIFYHDRLVFEQRKCEKKLIEAEGIEVNFMLSYIVKWYVTIQHMK
ncbi:hypothetical protein JS44_07030 [Anoxybacillus flavithermus]|uniref:Uncharacterized protein n=1 Tax=Anoxybacillus flavithermus TaxID=33934 RepID=A0A094JIR4_9BACL|nr:hypothetical protein JS44_07030 [Anoxybacillus flavithermus]